MKRPLKRGSYTNQMAFAVWNIARSNKQRAGGDSSTPVIPETVLTMTNSTLTEESTAVGFIVSTYTLTVYSGETVTVGFANGSNSNGYYEIDGNDVKLTTVGFNALNVGTVMPNVGLATSDSVTKYNQVTTILVDDPTYLTVNNGTITQGTTVAGNVVCTFTANDEDDALTFDFTSGTNPNGYYSISGFNILLTSDGETFLNASNEMPNVSISTNTGVTASNTITTTLGASRSYWKLNGSSYAQFTDQLVIVDSFSHKFKGVFPRASFHLLSDNRNSTDRVFLSASSYRLFGPTTAIVRQLTQAEFESITDGSVVELEYGRDDTGTWFITRNGVALGTAVENYGNNFTLNAFGDVFGGSTGIPRFTGVHWDHTIRTRDRTAVIPFDEAFSASNHTFKNSSGTVIGTKYNDLAADYTETKPS